MGKALQTDKTAQKGLKVAFFFNMRTWTHFVIIVALIANFAGFLKAEEETKEEQIEKQLYLKVFSSKEIYIILAFEKHLDDLFIRCVFTDKEGRQNVPTLFGIASYFYEFKENCNDLTIEKFLEYLYIQANKNTQAQMGFEDLKKKVIRDYNYIQSIGLVEEKEFDMEKLFKAFFSFYKKYYLKKGDQYED